MVGTVALSVCLMGVRPPERLPDLWTVAICIYACVHFVLFAVFFHIAQLSLSGSDDIHTATSSLCDFTSDDASSSSSFIFFSSSAAAAATALSSQKKHD